MTDYYSFHSFMIDVRGVRSVVIGKPGVWSWDRLNPGSEALIEMVRIPEGADVLDLGCGTGAIGAVIAKWAPHARVTLVDCDVAAVACAERTVSANALDNVQVELGDGALGLPSGTFDVVVAHLPRGRQVQEELIDGAARVLRPGGYLYVAASKTAGVKTAIEYASAVFGRCGVVRQKKGYHVAMAVRPEQLPEARCPRDGYESRTVVCDGLETTLVGKPGVFAWNRLDDGTARLIQTMEIRDDDRVLDLGCGTGLAGLVAARRQADGDVVCVDADIRAVEATRLTLAANDLTAPDVLVSDCASAVFDRSFDVVITNPPFHRGVGVDYEVAYQFIRDAARVLVPEGQLFLVCNAHLRYLEAIRESFRDVAIAYEDTRFRVIKASPAGR